MEVTLKAELRSGTGTGVARKLRAAGKVPGTLYGGSDGPQAIVVDARSLGQVLHTEAGRNVLIDLELDGSVVLAMARELQRDPIRGSVIHVDLLRINRNEKIQVDVPVHIEGDSPGVREGGVVEHHLWSVRLECLPSAVPEHVAADITPLALGESLHVSGLRLPAGVTMLSDADEIVVSVVVPQALKVEAEIPAEGAEAAAAPEAAPESGAGAQS